MAYTWSTFKTKVKQLITDVELSDTTAIMAISNFVKGNIALQVDKNAALAAAHLSMWDSQKQAMLGYTVSMGSDDLRAEINKLLTVDATRHGIYETGGFIDTLLVQARSQLAAGGTWIDNQIRQAVLDLQHHIELYRVAHEETYTVADVVTDREACTLTLPEEAMVRDVYYVQTDDDSEETSCIRMPVQQYDWQNRFDLTCGAPRMNGSKFYAALSPDGRTLMVFPTLLDGYHLSVFYDGLKNDFTDGSTVPFDEGAAMAVASYVRSRMHMMPPRPDLKLAAVFDGEYVRKRRGLYVDAKEKRELRYRNWSISPLGTRCSCAVCSSCSSSSDDGDSEEGTTATNCLAAKFTTVATIAALRDLPSHECRKYVFVDTPETGWHKVYKYVHGDATETDDENPDIIAPDDDKGRYFAYNLA